jgi:hypothetical protein
MKTRIFRAFLPFILMLVPAAASAAVLYKSVGPNGVVEFSDTPPQGNAVVIESRALGRPSASAAVASASSGSDGMPIYEDGSLARANAELDLAEHALAEALRAIGSPLAGLRLSAGRATSADLQRIAFYRRNVQLARTNLLEILRSRPVGAMTVASR